jgi:hypothetical protein
LGDRELAIEFAKQNSQELLQVPVRKHINGLIQSRRQPIPIEKIDLWKLQKNNQIQQKRGMRI